MTKQLAILPGDGIGPEIIAQAVRVLDKLIEDGLDVQYQYAPLGGAGYDEYGHPLPRVHPKAVPRGRCGIAARLLPKYDNLERPLRPERGLLAIRKDLNLFANLRPAILYKELANASIFETRSGGRFGCFDCARTHRRYLLRRTARYPHAGKRRARRLQHHENIARAKSAASPLSV